AREDRGSPVGPGGPSDGREPDVTARPAEAVALQQRGTVAAPSAGARGIQPGVGSQSDGAQAFQAGADRPKPVTRGVVALTNARIVPVTRPTIDRGTVVIRDG